MSDVIESWLIKLRLAHVIESWPFICDICNDAIEIQRRIHTRYTATHCNTLQHTATHCNTLQHTALHCNTLQHTATHIQRRFSDISTQNIYENQGYTHIAYPSKWLPIERVFYTYVYLLQADTEDLGFRV